MAQGSSNLNLNLTKIANTNISTSVGNTDAGTQRVIIASDQPAIFVNTLPAVYGLENVTITGTSGQFSCTEQDRTPLSVGQQITINGTLSGSGSITGYTSPKAYVVSQTNGSTTFTLVTLTGAAITTSTGTTTGLTFFMRGLEDVNIIGNARERFISIDNKLSNGTQKAILRSGDKGSTTASDVTSTAIDVNTQALDVVLKGGSTNTIGKLAANDGVDIGDVTINNTSIAVTDNGGSLTVDAPVATPVYVRLSNGTSAVDALPVTDNGGSLTVDGSVSVSNFPATQAVSIASLPSLAAGTNTIGKVDVNGTVPVSGTFWQATQPVSGTVSISGTVPISGALTDTQLRATAVPVSGTFWQATQPVSGTVAISGTVPISGALTDTQLRATAVPVSLASVPSHPVTNAGTFAVQATQSGTWNIGSITTLPSLAAGTNTIGKVDVNGTVPVSGTFWQTTQPVSIATLPSLAAGTNNIGVVSFSPNALVANAPTNASTTAYAASLVVKASAGVLYIVTGYNSRSSGQFIQVFDSATLPADTSVPKVIFYVESNSNFSFDLGVYGRAFSSGIVICNSSTGPTKTIGAADCWFDVQYK